MQGVRFVVGRPHGGKADAVQAIEFHAHEWTERQALHWLAEQGYRSRNLDREGRWLRYPVRDRSGFVPRTLRAVEAMTMATNSRKKKRSKRKASSKRRRRARAPSRAKVTRTTVKSVKVMKTNARRKKRRRPRKLTRNPKRGTSRYTVAFTPKAAQLFQRAALPTARRLEMRRALRRHPKGGVYVNLPSWHGSHAQALRLVERVRLVLAYALGRSGKSFSSVSATRVVAVP